MSLQAIVERKYCLQCSTTKALENTVMNTWHSSDIKHVLKNVFGRLKVVLCSILKAEVKNTLFEENRGVSSRNIKIERTIKELERDSDVIDLHNFQMEVNGENDDEEIEFESV